jgi:hypothetical protein
LPIVQSGVTKQVSVANLTDGRAIAAASAVISDNSANAALRVTQVGAGNALLVEDSANPDATPTVIDAVGRIVVGDFTARNTSSITGKIQIATSSVFDGGLAQYMYSADTNAQINTFNKSRGATLGTQTIVQSGDNLGDFRFAGSDGTNFIEAAKISSQVDGTPGANDMPGRLVFSTTPDGSATLAERMRIDSAGKVGIGGTPTTQNRVRLAGTSTGNTTQYGFLNELATASDVTGTSIGFTTSLSTAAAAFTLADLRHFSASFTTIGAGSTVTTQYGFFASSGLTGATNNFGFYSAIPSGTGRWNFYAAGTAVNYFAGNVGIGIDTPTQKLVMYQNAAVDVYTSSGNSLSTWLAGTSSTGNYAIFSNASSAITFSTTGAERGRISSTGVWSIGATVGSESLRVTPVASAVNYLNVQGAIAGQTPNISAEGSDTNIAFAYFAKGTGQHFFYGNNTPQFNIGNTASAVNYLRASGSATGTAATLSTIGTDTNIDLALTPKGTGNVRFGTHTGTADVAITGYIEVKDSAGNVRKLAVIT